MKKFLTLLIIFINSSLIFPEEKFYRFLEFDFIGRIELMEKITKSEFGKIESFKVYFDSKKREERIEICFKGEKTEKDIFNSGFPVSTIEISYSDTFLKSENESLYAQKTVYNFLNRKGETVKIFNGAERMVFISFNKKKDFENVVSYLENGSGKKVFFPDSVLFKITSIYKGKNSKRWETYFYRFDENGKMIPTYNILGFEKVVRNESSDNILDSLKLYKKDDYLVLNSEIIFDGSYREIKNLKLKKDEKGNLQKFYEIIFFDEIGYEFKKIFLDSLLKPVDMDSNFAIRIMKRNDNFTLDRVEYFSANQLLKAKMPPSIKYEGYPLFKILTKKFVYDKDYNLLGVEKIE